MMNEDIRTVTSAKKINDPITGTYCSIKAVIDGQETYVPLDNSNKDRILVKAWEDNGNTIADAD